jgi:hypothetical protein
LKHFFPIGSPQGRLEPNLAGMFLGWSSTKLLFFVPVGYSIWLLGSNVNLCPAMAAILDFRSA